MADEWRPAVTNVKHSDTQQRKHRRRDNLRGRAALPGNSCAVIVCVESLKDILFRLKSLWGSESGVVTTQGNREEISVIHSLPQK